MQTIPILRTEPSIGCIANAIEVLGHKWSALILKDLMSGPKHFCELERSVTKINPRILSQRLDYLEQQGIIISQPLVKCYQ
jgi:DNA-binding HxlR family transcriptional regulator